MMAVLNVTPDSFSDGGRYLDDEGALRGAFMEEARCFVADGALVLDLGGESTRPGAMAVPADEERSRILPALAALRADPVTSAAVLSIDTRHGSVAAAGLAAGADVINDVSGGADPALLEAVAASEAGLVLGHLRGVPATMMERIEFTALLEEVTSELGVSIERAEAAGIDRRRILIDPGVGFGKTPGQSAALVASGAALERRLGCSVLIGASRKRFIGDVTGRPKAERLAGSVGAAVAAVRHGARMVRVHDVAATVDALAVWRLIEQEARREGVA